MPRPDRRAERIPQIIEAAMAVFARSGFAQTRMEDIAREAGLSKATVYLYFPSKDELILAILQGFFDQGFSELDALLALDTPVADRLAGWARERAREMQQQAAFLSIGFEFYALAARQEATKQVLQRSYRQYRAGIAALIQQGQQRGELQAADPHDLAIGLISGLEGLTLLWMLDPEAVGPERAAEQTVRMLLRGAAG